MYTYMCPKHVNRRNSRQHPRINQNISKLFLYTDSPLRSYNLPSYLFVFPINPKNKQDGMDKICKTIMRGKMGACFFSWPTSF